jgi:hypothetical protein
VVVFALPWLQPESRATSRLTFEITSQGTIQGHVEIEDVSHLQVKPYELDI